jgi:hypothetical protein
VTPIFHHPNAIDPHIAYAFRQLVRIFKRRVIDHGVWIKNDNIGIRARRASVAKPNGSECQ